MINPSQWRFIRQNPQKPKKDEDEKSQASAEIVKQEIPLNKESKFKRASLCWLAALLIVDALVFRTSLSFKPYESILKIDRKCSGSRRAFIHQRRAQVKTNDGELKLRLILDRFSAEVFVNDGEQTLTATIMTDLAAQGISFCTDGQVEMDITKYDLFEE